MLVTIQQLIEQFGIRPTGVLHVGAHLGEEAAAYAGAGVQKVLWVESNPNLFEQLHSNVSAYPGQQAVLATISDRDLQEDTLKVSSFSMAASLLPMKAHLTHYPTMPITHEISVTTITVDTLLSNLGVDPSSFDMANLDIEGAELMALRGMMSVLPSLRCIYSEINFDEMYEGCALAGDTDSFLGDRGFSRVVTELATVDGVYKGFGDALYVRA